MSHHLCGVCSANPHKYRCPKCRVRYCSVACYKAHSCCATTASTSAAPEESNNSAPINQSRSIVSPLRRAPCAEGEGGGGVEPSGNDGPVFVPGGAVASSHVKRLCQDQQIMNYLSDSRLQDVMRTIDSSKNREKALAAALERNPSFRVVMEQILSVGGWVPPSGSTGTMR